MKKAEIKVGGHYLAKVSGRVVTVRVDAIREGGFTRGGSQTAYDVTNLATGRKTTFRSAAKFRGPSGTYGGGKRDEMPPPAPNGAPTGYPDVDYCSGEEPDCCESAPGDESCIGCGKPVRPDLTASAVPAPASSGEGGNDPFAQSVGASGPARPATNPSRASEQHAPGQPGYRKNAYRDDGTCWCKDCYTARKKAGISHVKMIDDREAKTKGDEQRPDPTTPVTSLASSATNRPTSATATKPSSAAPTVATRPVSGLTAKLAGLRMAEAAKVEPPHVIVIARAGTGKTTTMVEGLRDMRGVGSRITPSPQQAAVWEQLRLSRDARTVCVVAFNKSIAAELKLRVPAGCDAMTMHSMGYKAVMKALGRLEPNEYVVEDHVAAILGKDVRHLRKTCPVVLRATKELVSLCKMNLRDGGPEDCDELARHYDVELTDGGWGKGRSYRTEVFDLVPQVLERCKEPRGRIDFDDMIWLPVVLGLPVFQYDLLLVDEAQDLNRCQQALARRAGKRLVLVGDPKQAIYGFAGADAESMPRMSRELGATKAGVVELPLTVTRRCGRAIVEEAKKQVPDFEAHENNPEGRVTAAQYPTQGEGESRKELPWEQTYCALAAPGDFVLCRVNAPLVSQCFRFLKRNIRATIQGREIGKGLTALVKKLANGGGVPELAGRLDDWLGQETAKEQAKRNPSEAKLIAINDKHDCLACFMDGAASVDEVLARIDRLFTDNKDEPGVRLSSIHKAKGLEARRVFLLQPPKCGVPHPMAKSAWQREQEWNLLYVAVTRAIEELVHVS